MAGKAINRKPLECAYYIGIDSLSLARQPMGWNRGGKATRSIRIHWQGGDRTILSAEIRATTGLVTIEHHDANGLLIEQSVELATIPMPRGGQKWLFVCPVTGGHARKLYRYPGSGQFCSRKGLFELVTYRCQRDSGAKRVMRQIWEIRGRLRARGGLFMPFDQPDDMSLAEFIHHAGRYLVLANRLDFSTHGIKFRRPTSGEGYPNRYPKRYP